MLSYNGVVMDLDSVQDWHSVPIYLHGKYLYHDTRARFRVLLNPKATAYFLPGTYGAFGRRPVHSVSSTLPRTITAVRQALLTPRKQLIYTRPGVGNTGIDEEVLVSPQRRPDNPNLFYATDAALGPFPLDFAIVRVHGNKTVEADWSVRTCLNECQLFSTEPSPVLALVWRMSRRTDQDAFSTRVIDGEVVFRTDRLAQLAAKPDDYVGAVVHPCPRNMQRASVETYPSEDGTRLTYRVVDTERPVNILEAFWKQYHVSRIEAYQSLEISRPNPLAFNYTDAGGFSAPGGGGKSGPRPFWDFAGKILPKAVGPLLPRLLTTVVVRVWGNRAASRQDLATAAGKMFDEVAKSIPPATVSRAFKLTEDLMGTFVEMQVALEGGPLQTTTGLGAFSVRNANLRERMTRENGLPGVTSTDVNVVNPQLPAYGNTRGTFWGALVSQGTKDACDGFDTPGDPPDFVVVSSGQ